MGGGQIGGRRGPSSTQLQPPRQKPELTATAPGEGRAVSRGGLAPAYESPQKAGKRPLGKTPQRGALADRHRNCRLSVCRFLIKFLGCTAHRVRSILGSEGEKRQLFMDRNGGGVSLRLACQWVIKMAGTISGGGPASQSPLSVPKLSASNVNHQPPFPINHFPCHIKHCRKGEYGKKSAEQTIILLWLEWR